VAKGGGRSGNYRDWMEPARPGRFLLPGAPDGPLAWAGPGRPPQSVRLLGAQPGLAAGAVPRKDLSAGRAHGTTPGGSFRKGGNLARRYPHRGGAPRGPVDDPGVPRLQGVWRPVSPAQEFLTRLAIGGCLRNSDWFSYLGAFVKKNHFR